MRHFLAFWLGSGAICPSVRAKKRRAVFLCVDGCKFPATKNVLGSFVVSMGEWRIFILLIFLTIAFPSYGHDAQHQSAYRATIIRIIDGDTFEADIHIFINLTARHHIRIADINTAEIKRSECEAERDAGKQAKARLAEMLQIDSMVTLSKLSFDSFGRIISHVHHDALGNIGNLLLQENHAQAYGEVGKGWCG